MFGARGEGQGAWVVATLLGTLLLASACGNAEPPKGQPTGFATQEHHPVTAELVAEHASIQPLGTTRIGALFDIASGWHIYAEDPGDAGMPTTVTWQPFPGAQFGPLQWPAPEEFVDPGEIHTRGYTGHAVLHSSLTLITRETPPELPLAAKVSWLACKEICIPGKADLELALPVTSAPPQLSTHAELFSHTSPE